MIHKITKSEFDKYVDYIYAISSDLSRSVFPIYADGVKTKEFFYTKSKKGLTQTGEEILLYDQGGSVQGWIHYYFIESDKYLGLSSMLIKSDFGKALSELFQYWRERFGEYSWCFYLPSDNVEGLDFMKKNGFSAASRDTVDVLLFKDYIPGRKYENVIPISSGNFELFGNIHRRYDEEMYWTCDRIKNDLDRWRIFAYIEKGKCLGALYYVCAGKDLEIFGIDYAEEQYAPDVTEALLISGLNAAKAEGAQSMYFFNDDMTRTIAEKVGFRRITEAFCFEGVI